MPFTSDQRVLQAIRDAIQLSDPLQIPRFLYTRLAATDDFALVTRKTLQEFIAYLKSQGFQIRPTDRRHSLVNVLSEWIKWEWEKEDQEQARQAYYQAQEQVWLAQIDDQRQARVQRQIEAQYQVEVQAQLEVQCQAQAQYQRQIETQHRAEVQWYVQPQSQYQLQCQPQGLQRSVQYDSDDDDSLSWPSDKQEQQETSKSYDQLDFGYEVNEDYEDDSQLEGEDDDDDSQLESEDEDDDGYSDGYSDDYSDDD